MRVEIGDVSTTVPAVAFLVTAQGGTEGPLLHPDVIIDRTDLSVDTVAQMTTAQARRLAALLTTAADTADRLVLRIPDIHLS